MKASVYLYGTEPTAWVDLPYIQAVEKKIQLGYELLDELLHEHYKDRDDYRITEVRRAIKFNEELIRETVR